MCSSAQTAIGAVLPLSDVVDQIQHKQENWSKQGQRVIMACYKKFDADTVPLQSEEKT